MADLFGVRRSAAADIMHRIGAHKAGNAHVVARRDLLLYLLKHYAGEPYAATVERRERIQDLLARSRPTPSTAIPVTKAEAMADLETLPQGVTLEPGRLVVAHDGFDSLAAKLFAVARAMMQDEVRFRQAV